MTPRQLKYFVEIARTGSITTAASTLHIAQPALSHHVAAMEEELGVPLFERHARGVNLTTQGRRFLDRATSILRQMDRLADDVRDASTLARGTVSLCIVGSVAPVLAAPLLQALASQGPEVTLQLSTGISREVRALVEARRIDLALLPAAFELPRLEIVPVFEEQFYLVGTPENIGTTTTPIPFRELQSIPLVAPDREHDLRRLIERTALAQGCTLDVRYEINNAELLRSVVLAGLASAVLTNHALPCAETAGIVAREIIEPTIERTQSLAWALDHPLTPAGALVRGVLLDSVAAMIDEGTLKARSLA